MKKEKRDVILKIMTTASTGKRDRGVTELTVPGHVEYEDGRCRISYESEDGGLGEALIELTFEKNEIVTMVRTGPVSSQMIVEKNRRHMCHYTTPYGDFMLGVFGQNVRADMREHGGELDFRYSIDINSTFTSVNEVSIKVMEAQ